MDETNEESVRSYYARGLQLSADASWEQIDTYIDTLPADSIVHPQDIRDAIAQKRARFMAPA